MHILHGLRWQREVCYSIMVADVHVWMSTENVISLLYFHVYLIAELLFFPLLVLYKLLLEIILLLLEVEPTAV